MGLITTFKNQSPQLRQWLFIFLIIGIFAYTYSRSQVNTWKSPPNLANYAQALSIAISELKYGSEQSIGYLKIYNLFTPLYGPGVDWGPEFSTVDAAIEEALHLKDVAADGIHSSNYEGLSTYYKLALWLFGYKAESAFYLFWTLAAIPILIYVITFFHRPVLLFYLLLFVVALLAVSQTQGVLIESIVRNRFFPVLAIVPSFYLALLIARERKADWITIPGALGQAIILTLLVYVRPSSGYQFLFLVSISVLVLILGYKKNKFFNLSTPVIRQLWPIAMVIICYGLVRWSTLNPVFSNTLTNRSCTWHMFYMGLGGHPKALERYGIFPSDGAVIELVIRRSAELGYNFNPDINQSLINISGSEPKNVVVCDKTYEKIVKDEFFRIFEEDPQFVLTSYLYKFVQYFQIFVSPLDHQVINLLYRHPLIRNEQDYFAFGVLEGLINWPAIMALTLGVLLVKDRFLREWLLPLLILLVGFGGAFLVPIVYYPSNNTIVDSALYLTIILLASVSGSICYGLSFVPKTYLKRNSLRFAYLVSFVVFVVGITLFIGFSERPKEIGSNLAHNQFYGQILDHRIEIYQQFDIFLYQNKYYALTVEQWPIDLTDQNALKECQAKSECVIGSSLVEVKQRLDKLNPPPVYHTTGLLREVSSSSHHPAFGSPKFLFDHTPNPANAWHSMQNPTFPQWIDLDFQQPVIIEFLGFQAQIGEGNQSRAPQDVVVLGGQDPDTAEYRVKLQFQFKGAGTWSSRPLPQTGQKFQHYRLQIMSNQKQADFVTIQEMWLRVSVEKDYKGFDILWENGQYYVLAQELHHSTILPPEPLDPAIYESFCVKNYQCGMVNSLEEAKKLVDQLTSVPQ